MNGENIMRGTKQTHH